MRYAPLVAVVLALVSPGRATADQEYAAVELEHHVIPGDDPLHGYATVADAGAEVVIVIPGGPGLSHEYTRPLATPIAGAGHRAILYDPPGTGPDGHRATTHETERLAQDIERIRVWSGREQVHLVAHSWGGFVVGAYLDAHPARVASIALVDAVPPSDDGLLRTSRSINERVEAMGLVEPIGAPCQVALTAILPAYFHDPEHEATTHLSGSRCDDTVFASATWASVGHDFTEAARAFDGPVLVVQGASDPFGEDVFLDLRQLYDASSWELIPECGHIPWEECAPDFDRAFSPFLSSMPATDDVEVVEPAASACGCPDGAECTCRGGQVATSRAPVDLDGDGSPDGTRFVRWDNGTPYQAEDTRDGEDAPFWRRHCLRSGEVVSCREYDVDADNDATLQATFIYELDDAGMATGGRQLAESATRDCEAPRVPCVPMFCRLTCEDPPAE